MKNIKMLTPNTAPPRQSHGKN